MVERDEEVEYAWLERGEDCVDCVTDRMVRVDEELAKSGFALTTERNLIVELERRGPIFVQIWSPGVGKRPKVDSCCNSEHNRARESGSTDVSLECGINSNTWSSC